MRTRVQTPRDHSFTRTLFIVDLLLLGFSSSVLMALALFEYWTNSDYQYYVLNLEPVGIFFIVCLGLLLLLLIVFFILLRRQKARSASLIIKAGAPLNHAAQPAPEAVKEEGPSRFSMLSEIDKKCGSFEKVEADQSLTLRDVCTGFRDYCSSSLGLYYSLDDIRRFLSGLCCSRLLVLQGMSGTGKTSLPNAFGKYVENGAVIVPIQPMWKERTDLLGYYNEFTKKFNETQLLETLYEASYSDKLYLVVLDEVNIARVEYYFAEFLSLLELPDPEKRQLEVVSDERENDPKLLHGGRLRLPDNVWFIGTANNDDSTFAISDKVYDRAMILNLDSRSKPFSAPKASPVAFSSTQLYALASASLKDYRLTERNLRRINSLDAYLSGRFHISFGNRIMKQIQSYVSAYVACGGEELAAIDDIMSKKVLRKLESQNPVYVRGAAEALCNYLDELFGNDAMPLCKAYIRRLEQNA
jgi:hypothetical protein